MKKFILGEKISRYNRYDLGGMQVEIMSRTDNAIVCEVPYPNGMYPEVLTIETDEFGNEYVIWDKYNSIEYRTEAETEATVLVDFEHLNADGYGDFIRCSDCGTLFLLGMGDEGCKVCRRKNLAWIDENLPECSVENLRQLGYNPIGLNQDSVNNRLEELFDRIEEVEKL